MQDVAILRQRLEILEELVELIRGGSGGGSTFAGPIVARLTATSPGAGSTLESQVAANGEQIFVLTNRSIWTKINGVAGTVGVPALSPMEVIAALDGTGVFTRTMYSDPALRIGVNDLWIDPANPAANDENSGLTALAPLKTGMELFRRWGWGAQVLVSTDAATSPLGFIVIHVQSDLVSPDSLPMNVITSATTGGIWIEAPLLAANILRTSTLTDAVTPMDRAAPAPGGTRLTIRDNTLASWAAFEVANRRVRFIDGPAIGGTLQPQTDNLATPGQVQCSACQTTNPSGFSQTAVTVTPAVGNTYVVEKLVQVNLGMPFQVDQEVTTVFGGGFDVFVNLVNINLPTTGLQLWKPIMSSGAWTGPFLNLYQCTVDRAIDYSAAGPFFSVASYYTCGFFAVGTGDCLVSGGGANVVASSIFPEIIWGARSLVGGIDQDFVSNKMPIFGDNSAGRNFAVWNCAAGTLGNVGGHGVLVGLVIGAGAQRGSMAFNGTCWGQGNAGVGILIGAGLDGVGAPQNITGVAGDLKLANKQVGWWWNDATGVYNPVGAGIATTWANLAAAEGAAGFGGNAHELDSDSHFVAAETTA